MLNLKANIIKIPDDVIEKINAVLSWQKTGWVHELTCGFNSQHILVPMITSKLKIELICPEEDCYYKQKNIPKIVFDFYTKNKDKI